MSKYLNIDIDTIFIMLGDKCNFNCKYCMQVNYEREQITNDINGDIFKFIEELSDSNNDRPLRLHFYGGEPLLYFNNIKDIVEKTKLFKNKVAYSFISNGSLITDEMVEFFNDNNFNETISWDGYNTKDTRIIDVFSDKVIRDRLLKLNSLNLSAVISAYAYPLDIITAFNEISAEYEAIHKYSISVNLDELFDTGCQNRSLFDIDYDKVSSQMYELCDKFMYDNSTGKITLAGMYIKNMVSNVKNSINRKSERVICSCSNGYSVLNMDLDGNLYNCHNDYIKLGTIYDSYFSYLNNVIAHDTTKSNLDAGCRECDARFICNSGCKLISQENRDATYCKLKKAVIIPILSFLMKVSDDNDKTV